MYAIHSQLIFDKIGMTSLRSVLWSTPVRVLVIGLLVSLAVIFSRQFGLLEPLELAAYDWTVRLAPSPVGPDPRIVLITITEEDLQSLGQWPLSDELIARALEILTGYGARTIGLDLYRDREVLPGREELNAVLSQHSEIVTVMKFPDQEGKGVPGPLVLQGTDQIGFNDILVDRGGIVRRGFLFLENQEGTATSFSLLLAMKYLEHEGIVPVPDPSHPELMRIGTTTIPRFYPNDGSYVGSDAKGYQLLVKFSGKQEAFPQFTLTELLNGTMNQAVVKDKVVVIGSSAESVRDDFYTPYSRSRGKRQQMSGMELHAHFINQLLRMALMHDRPIRSLPEGLEVCWVLIWGGLGGLLALGLFSPWRLIFFLSAGVGGLLVFVYWLFLASWWIPLISPALAWVLAGSVATAWISKQYRQERMLLMQLFSQHVSTEVAETIWAAREQLVQDGRIRPRKITATVLFVDLEGFTAMAEHVDPEALMEWLNTYLMSMTNVIVAHKGVVDDFFGDGVKANFGVPLEQRQGSDIRQDAMNAVQCGLALFKEIQCLNQRLPQQAIPIGRVRIGIATGSVVVGTVGNAQRLKYTSVGDIVNIAARLEQLGKDPSIASRTQGIGSLFVNEDTHAYLDARWVTEEIGPVNLSGRQEPVTVYRVVRGPSE